MTRLTAFVAASALALALAPAVSAQNTKTVSANGTVSAVAADSLTVKSGTDEVKFMIDKDTQVTARGATHKSLALKADGKSAVLGDFVKSGDRVRVDYHDMGTMKHASLIAVLAPAAPK